MHLNSELLFREYALKYFKPNLKILEIGPSGYPSAYQKLVNKSDIIWHTIDFPDTKYIDTAIYNLTYQITSPYNFPIEDNVYDIILSGQVIEHVEKIWEWLKELKRIIKPGGHIITINPLSWPYHEAPIDCWRIFPNGIKALAEECDLKIKTCLFESLEMRQILEKDSRSKFIPGRSYNYLVSSQKLNAQILFNKFIRKVPFLQILEQPIEISFDAISILSK